MIADLKPYKKYRTLGCCGSVIGQSYKPEPLSTFDEITADIFAIEQEAEGLVYDFFKENKV
jgi:hypothetical protein